MTRVADAFGRSGGELATTAAFRATDHPWGERPAAAETETGTSSWAADELSVERSLPVTDSHAGPATVSTVSPLGGLDAHIRQQLAGLVERVFLPATGDAPRVIGFAAVQSDAHSAWLSAAVAALLAHRTSANVCAVDLDFADPRLHASFGIGAVPGLLDVLNSPAPLEATARPVDRNLWILPAGERQDGLVELPAASRARIARLRHAFDHVVCNLGSLAAWCGGGPPTMVDGIVLVIATDGTRREAGRRVAERLNAAGVRILGAVLTDRRYAIPDVIYRWL